MSMRTASVAYSGYPAATASVDEDITKTVFEPVFRMLMPCTHEEAPEGCPISVGMRIGSVVLPLPLLALPVMDASCVTVPFNAAV